jgi:hypothetical protein
MSEPLYEPTPEQRFLDREQMDAELRDRAIGAVAARIIAGRWHSGQTSPLYAFASSGAIEDGLVEDIHGELMNPELEPANRRELEHQLGFVTVQRVNAEGERPAQKNWHLKTKFDERGGTNQPPLRGVS